MTTEPWWNRGARRTASLPIDTWLPGFRGRNGWNDRQQAAIDACAAVCATCPVIRECNADAVATEGEVAIRAGRTYEDRHGLDVGNMPPRTGGIRRRPISHGRHSGYQAHQLRGEAPCEECRAAERIYQSDYKRRRRTGVAS